MDTMKLVHFRAAIDQGMGVCSSNDMLMDTHYRRLLEKQNELFQLELGKEERRHRNDFL